MGKTLREIVDEYNEQEYRAWVARLDERVEIVITPPDILMYSGLFYNSSQAWLREANLQA